MTRPLKQMELSTTVVDASNALNETSIVITATGYSGTAMVTIFDPVTGCGGRANEPTFYEALQKSIERFNSELESRGKNVSRSRT